MAVANIDPNLFLIMKVLDRYGHEKLPLKIVKEKQSYIVGHEREVPYFDGREGHRIVVVVAVVRMAEEGTARIVL
jgi:hypothetical protein